MRRRTAAPPRTQGVAHPATTIRRLAFPFLLALAACEDPLVVRGERPATREEVAQALDWYSSTANCLTRGGTTRMADYGHRVRWWVASIIRFPEYGRLSGAQRSDDIWILESRVHDPTTWIHESMHHILWANTGDGDSEHTDPLWSRCGS